MTLRTMLVADERRGDGDRDHSLPPTLAGLVDKPRHDVAIAS